MTFHHFSPQRLLSGAIKAISVTALCGLAACTQLQTPPGVPASAPPAATVSAAKSPTSPTSPTSATPAIGPLLNIDTSQSLIAVTVRRGGVLARLGHEHVVASRTITGTVEPSQNRADFQFRLDQMTVDEAGLRAIAGLKKQPSADAIEGTRTNMLTKVLDAEHYPVVAIHAERTARDQPLQVAITLHGVTRKLAIPVDLREENGVITVTGTVNLKQTDFNLVPFSVMAGAMAVLDQMELRFTLVAR